MIFGHPIQKLVLDRFWITFGRRRDAPLEEKHSSFAKKAQSENFTFAIVKDAYQFHMKVFTSRRWALKEDRSIVFEKISQLLQKVDEEESNPQCDKTKR